MDFTGWAWMLPFHERILRDGRYHDFAASAFEHGCYSRSKLTYLLFVSEGWQSSPLVQLNAGQLARIAGQIRVAAPISAKSVYITAHRMVRTSLENMCPFYWKMEIRFLLMFPDCTGLWALTCFDRNAAPNLSYYHMDHTPVLPM